LEFSNQSSAKSESVGKSAIPVLHSRIDSDTDPDADPEKTRSLIQREVRTAALVSDANTEKGGATIGVGVGIGIGIEKTED